MSEVKKRNEISENYKWELECIFENDGAWEASFSRIREEADCFSSLCGKVCESAEKLLSALNKYCELSEGLLSLAAYACMRRDEDNTVSKYRAMADRVGELEAEVAAKCAFFEPELIGCGYDKIKSFMKDEKELFAYSHFFDNLFREAVHILDGETESLLARSAPMGDAAHDIFSAMNNADMSFSKVVDKEGNEHELTHSRYGIYLESRDRVLRKSAYDSMYAEYEKYKNTFAAMYAGNVKSDFFYAKTRKFESTLSMKLSDSNISEAVYNNLICEVGNGIDALSEYLRLAKARLGYDELYMYDLYTPLTENDEEYIPYDEACRMVLAAVSPLGEVYCEDLKRALQSRWVDVFENCGKTSGAYSWGDNTHHPFVLLNYQGTIEDVFTLAHEMGHAMHSYYTNNTQPYIYRDYKIFVAEVASIVNENLLLAHLLESAKGKRRAYLLGRKLEAIRTTFFRQTMFAEFEKMAHDEYVKGEALTAEFLCEMYGKLNRKYYGSVCTCDDRISYEWARIPHFYTSFYVYQYATGYAAATKIAELCRNSSAAAKGYMEFLKSGNSDYPMELLRKIGVDLTAGDAARSVIADMKLAVHELSDK